jgi:hypothetical protein
VSFGNAAVPEVQINHSFYVFGYAKKKKKYFILVGPRVIVAAPVADKKLENYAFQQQLTSFFKIRLNYSSFVSGIANSICCSLSFPNMT